MLGSINRFWKQNIKRFGVYDIVAPEKTTPSRIVPNDIERPNYSVEPPIEPEIKNEQQLSRLKESCSLASTILNKLDSFIKPGITTDDIDEFVHNLCIQNKAYPSPLHYEGYPKSVCTSVNNVCVHGIPDLRPLQNGDIVNVDITVFYKGNHGDCSKTFLVGDVDDRGIELVNVTRECLYNAISICGPGVNLNFIGQKIYEHASRNGLTVMPAFLGHGIGSYFHGPPDIYHTCNFTPEVMKTGMTFTIEPVLSHGSDNTVLLEDGWTIVTDDGSRTAQEEHTILITENGADILTKINK